MNFHKIFFCFSNSLKSGTSAVQKIHRQKKTKQKKKRTRNLTEARDGKMLVRDWETHMLHNTRELGPVKKFNQSIIWHHHMKDII